MPLVASAQTKRTIHVATAGTLSNYISNEEKYQIEELTLTGELNGDDLGYIREMAGRVKVISQYSDLYTQGSLSILNIENVNIVAGGNFYYADEWDTAISDHEYYYLNNNNTLPTYVFNGCKSLKSIILPNSVTSIESHAFSDCSGLTSITIPNSVTSIGWYAFYDCSGLTSITIPNSVTSIGSWAFFSCSGLTSITIPNSVTSIGSEAFKNTGWYNNQPDGLVYAGNFAYNYKGTMPNNTSIIIKDGTVGIADRAFWECSGLTSITIPNSVTYIGSEAFWRCSGLTSITIPNSVTSIENYAFSDCSGLTSITIPNSVTSIGYNAFSGCSGLTSIVSEIENPFAIDNVFYCYSKDIYATATLIVPPGKKSVYQNTAGWKKFQNIGEAELMGYEFENSGIRYKIGENNTVSVVSRAEKYSGDVVIPSQVSYHGSNYDVTAIGPSAFEGCVDMTSVTIPSSVTTIGGAAFYYCTGLTTVDIPNGVTTIGEGAFSKCEGLTSVTIPGSVTTIDSNAFFQCYALTQITSWIENPFVINSNVFPTSVYSNATLNVPSGKKTVYQNTTGWKKFENISESSKCAKPIISYSNGKISFSCETEGVEFHYTISNTNSSTGVGSSVNFSPTVNISVYASKSGFANSDTSTTEIVVPAGLRGDLTGDGQVNVADHVELSKIILGQ